MIEVKGKQYLYTNTYPDGTIVHRPQKQLTEEGNEILNDAMVRLFESLPEEKKELIFNKFKVAVTA